LDLLDGNKSKEQKNVQKQVQNKSLKETNRKLTYKERLEMEALEKEIPALETEKAEIEQQLSSGTLDTDGILRASQRFAELTDLIDEKTMRWLELSEV